MGQKRMAEIIAPADDRIIATGRRETHRFGCSCAGLFGVRRKYATDIF
jgi:hypothetical protein